MSVPEKKEAAPKAAAKKKPAPKKAAKPKADVRGWAPGFPRKNQKAEPMTAS